MRCPRRTLLQALGEARRHVTSHSEKAMPGLTRLLGRVEFMSVNRKFVLRRCLAWRAVVAGLRRAGGGISRPAGAHHRRLSARRLDRHLRPPVRAMAEREARPAVHRSRTSRAPATISAPSRPPSRRRTATRCFSPIRPTPSTPRSTSSSISSSCATSRRSPASSACPT